MSASIPASSTRVEDHESERSTASDSVSIQGELENHEEVKRLSLKTRYLWALGISIALGGQYIGWNKSLHAGFGSALIATVLIATAYWCLVLCIAEVSSAIPFGGGSYGIARVTLGFFPGYMVAFMESSQSVIFVASAAITFGKIITSIVHTPRDYEPFYWLFFYGTSLITQICGGRTFWYMNMAVAVLSLCVILMYIFGCIKDCNFPKYAMLESDEPMHRWFRGGGMEFMRILPLPCWFYVGIECVNLSCKDVPNPREQVPRGYLSSMATLFCTSIVILFCCSSLHPGVATLMHELNPLHHEFEVFLNIHDSAAGAIALPSIYATCSGFMYVYGKQFKAMAKSGLIPPFMAQTYPGFKTPVNALLVGSLLSFILCIIVHYEPILEGNHLFNISMLCAFSAYSSQFASFIIFRYKFPTIKREFESPLGAAGAVYGFVVFTLAFLGICAFQDDVLAVSVFVGYCVLVVGYYFWAAQERQSFSEEEKSVMFRAYLMKSNNDRNTRIKKGKSVSGGLRATLGSSSSHSASTPNKYAYKATPTSASASTSVVTPRTIQEESAIQMMPMEASTKNGSRRIKLLFNTGSGRIAMTGEVHPEEIPDGALPDTNLDDPESGVFEEVPMTQSILLPEMEQQELALTDIYSGGDLNNGDFSSGPAEKV